ncbi:DUF427 domain-containing protein [Puniceibacterium sp. IMCC21224]|uniref:DUF427 domain-containing protein n=1 Tax=Puniceibacterium sp. IMCC21224 TaxID=1618204 RepID=UPI00064E0B59|nr:DUF427 domain-containing protein [Puniceibacterium sp. IMCC21224]KMK67879.1 hypothetical protein IMCC21224_112756 [Puniceibacterium sp. IMCC21224]
MKHVTIRPADGTWTVRAGGAVLGESSRALELTEGEHPYVIYFPRDDIAMALLDRTEQTTTSPHLGDASYFSIVSRSHTYVNAVWSYENPTEDVAQIKDHLAFYVQNGVAVEQV